MKRGPAGEAPTAAQHLDAAGPQREAAMGDWYRGQADKLRARAARPNTSAEDRAEYEQRAAWYEARAKVKQEGGFMPRELRTPSESAQGADYARRGICDLLTVLSDLDGPEVGMFAGAVAKGDRATAITETASLWNSLVGGLTAFAGAMGATRNPSTEPGAEPWIFAEPTAIALEKAAAIVGRKGDEPTREDDNGDARPQPTVKVVAKVDPRTGAATPIGAAPADASSPPATPSASANGAAAAAPNDPAAAPPTPEPTP